MRTLRYGVTGGRTRIHTQVTCSVPSPQLVSRSPHNPLWTGDEPSRISLQHPNCHTTPHSLGLDALMGRWQITFYPSPASQHKTHSEAKQKTRWWALQQPVLPSYPEEYVHELSTGAGGTHHYVMSEGRQQGAGKPEPINAPVLCPQRYKFTFDNVSVSVFYGLHVHDWLFKRQPQIPANLSGLN